MLGGPMGRTCSMIKFQSLSFWGGRWERGATRVRACVFLGSRCEEHLMADKWFAYQMIFSSEFTGVWELQMHGNKVK